MSNYINKTDPEIAWFIGQETKRQKDVLELIPSENYASKAVREALGSVLTNKYSEGYPRKRYYQGNKYIDEIEELAISRAKELFGVPHANVQPYSGSPANAAVYFALLDSGDTIMGLKLSAGGHLTHGHPSITFSGKYFHSVQYDVDADGWLNMEEISRLARKTKPKMIIVGTTAYPRIFDWDNWKAIADDVGAWFLADISHIAGLVVGGVHSSPVPFADIVMTTTHKTLRGPRGALLMVTSSGIKKDPKMGEKIDKAVFPGIQGGPHDNVTAAIAIALKEAASPEFKRYSRQIIHNAKELAQTLIGKGSTLVTDGTDNHLIVVDLRPQGLSGNVVAEALEVAGIVVNKNSVPHDIEPPFYPSGIRLGAPAITTRGMKEREMDQIGGWMSEVINVVKGYRLPEHKDERSGFLARFRREIAENKKLLAIAQSVKTLCGHFPVP